MTGMLTLLTLLLLFLCAYVYVGYPVLLVLLSRLARNPIQHGDVLPPVSLIVAAYNESEVIEQKIRNSLELDYPSDKLQIMIVADGSSDDTADIARRYEDQGVVVLHTPERRGKSAALNRGVEQATGDILVFSDANAFYLPEAIRMLVRNFNDSRVGCVSGKKTVRQEGSTIAQSEGMYWKYESFLKKKESEIRSTVGVVGEMNSLRREFYQPIPKHIINDDAYLAMKTMQAGKRVIYEPEAVSWETSAASTRDEIIRRQRINAGRWQLFFSPGQVYPWNDPLVLFKLFSHKFFRLMLPFFMLGGLILNVIVVLLPDVSPLMWVTLLVQVAFYVLALAGFLAEQAGVSFKIGKLAYYIVSSNGAAIRGFNRYIRGKQSVLWEKARRGPAT